MAYNSSEAYDFSLFEPQVIEYPNKKQTKAPAKAKNAKKPQKSRATTKKSAPRRAQNENGIVSSLKDYQVEVERDAQTAKIPDYAVKLVCFALVCAVLVVFYLMQNTKCDTLISEISAMESQIEIEKGETVRLNAELSSKISTDKIEDYAENVLGMVKAENYQINYIDLSEGDQILISGDKTANGESELTGKIKELIAYIF